VSKEPLDASVGLAFSLSLFGRYRKSGRLQAELHHVPGIRGSCIAYLDLVEGKLTSCYVKDNGGQSRPIEKATLIRVDNERGPFEWKLQSISDPSTPAPSIPGIYQKEQYSPTPKTIAPLNLEQLRGWTPHSKFMLTMVYNAINGQKTISEIKQEVPLQAHDIEEALRILQTLHIITIAG
jgi:hypothetical protein